MQKKILILVVISISSLLVASLVMMPKRFWDNVAEEKTPIDYRYRVINTYPHDHKAFTQGLIYHEGVLYESTGKWGESSL
ncbi:MAG: glutaminyl-peptide cyclotransferase, partial [Candidatus Parabeggiatoa sp.]|nr:glutaminyl-peptide cyclotransferase [Candidatus Parabeggiatoa sp.]